MSNHTYNTSHGNFYIEASKVPHVRKALFEYGLETGRIVGTSVFDNIESAFAHFDLGCTISDEGNIVDLYLNTSYLGETIEQALAKVIAPFVREGSFLVFYQDNCFAYYFEKNKETDLVEGHSGDVIAVLNRDLARMYVSLQKKDPVLYAEMQRIYPFDDAYIAAATKG